MLDDGANISKVRYLPGKHNRRCGRYKCEGVSALPGEISDPAIVLSSSRGGEMGLEKSAEVILACLSG